jgi:hypothetical protein
MGYLPGGSIKSGADQQCLKDIREPAALFCGGRRSSLSFTTGANVGLSRAAVRLIKHKELP